jgi:hypothetical protein
MPAVPRKERQEAAVLPFRLPQVLAEQIPDLGLGKICSVQQRCPGEKAGRGLGWLLSAGTGRGTASGRASARFKKTRSASELAAG